MCMCVYVCVCVCVWVDVLYLTPFSTISDEEPLQRQERRQCQGPALLLLRARCRPHGEAEGREAGAELG